MKNNYSATIYRLSLMAAILLVQFFVYSRQANASSFTFGAGSGTTVSTITLTPDTQSTVTSGYIQVDPSLITERFRAPYSSTQPTETTAVTVSGPGVSSGIATPSAVAGNVSNGLVVFNTAPIINSAPSQTSTASNATATGNQASTGQMNSGNTAVNNNAPVSAPVPDRIEEVKNNANTNSPAAQPGSETLTGQKQEAPLPAKPASAAPAPAVNSMSSNFNLTAPSAVPVKTTSIAVNPKEGTYVSSLKELQSLKSWQTWKDPNTNKVYKIQAKTAAAANTIKAKLNMAVKAAVIKKTK